jgi:hypothetical protein
MKNKERLGNWYRPEEAREILRPSAMWHSKVKKGG